MRRVLLASVLLLAGAAAHAQAPAPAENMEPPAQKWSFSGPFGTFDRASAQRGFQIYQQVCSSCHSLRQAYYRNLEGIGLTPEQVTSIAAGVTVPTLGDDGQPAERPALPSDHFKLPFPNERAARAALNGALPPDQSVIEKAREGGADYIYNLLMGYGDPPSNMKMGAGMYYNRWFTGHQLAMPPPLRDGQMAYADGTKPSMQQEARDITTFLTYIANPEMEQRKAMGVKAVLFLTLLTGLTYAVKRQVWSDVH